MWRGVFYCVMGSCLAVSASCGAPELRIGGQVTVDGKPIDSGTIRFEQVDNATGKSAGRRQTLLPRDRQTPPEWDLPQNWRPRRRWVGKQRLFVVPPHAAQPVLRPRARRDCPNGSRSPSGSRSRPRSFFGRGPSGRINQRQNRVADMWRKGWPSFVDPGDCRMQRHAGLCDGLRAGVSGFQNCVVFCSAG